MKKGQVRRREKAILWLAVAMITCFGVMQAVQRPVYAAEQDSDGTKGSGLLDALAGLMMEQDSDGAEESGLPDAVAGQDIDSEEAQTDGAGVSEPETDTEKTQEKRNSQYNILLIGTDKRDESWNGNSDVMIVATLRRDTKEIILTSFMRDLYADIPGYGIHKLNYAYAAGGAETLMATLKDNYELDIDNYAVVDFGDMAGIIDLVGGVEITVSDAEVSVLNGYLTSMNAEEDYLSYGGTYLLNGNQAVAYMRIRYVGNNDYQRTQRQRDVLKEIFASMRGASVKTLTELAMQLFTGIENDIGPLEMMSLLKTVPELGEYELCESRVPYDDLYTSQNEMLVPDFEATIERLHEELGE